MFRAFLHETAAIIHASYHTLPPSITVTGKEVARRNAAVHNAVKSPLGIFKGCLGSISGVLTILRKTELFEVMFLSANHPTRIYV